MGYTTDFYGTFKLDRPLTEEHSAYLEAFASTRRVKRDAAVAAGLPDRVRVAAGLPIGVDGAYFTGGVGSYGQDKDPSILKYNAPPSGQPGLWCQWVPSSDDTGIEWDGGEKFCDYEEWLVYLVQHFLKPWGYVLNGQVKWIGEDPGDMGMLVVEDNKVSHRLAKITYE